MAGETPLAQDAEAQHAHAENGQRPRFGNRDSGEKAFRLRVKPSCEVQDIGVPAAAVIPECQGPKTLPSRITVEGPDERASCGVIGVDFTAARVASAAQVAIGEVAD